MSRAGLSSDAVGVLQFRHEQEPAATGAEAVLGSLGKPDHFCGLSLVVEVELRKLGDHLDQIHSQAGLRLATMIGAAGLEDVLLLPHVDPCSSARPERHLPSLDFLSTTEPRGLASSGWLHRRSARPPPPPVRHAGGRDRIALLFETVIAVRESELEGFAGSADEEIVAATCFRYRSWTPIGQLPRTVRPVSA